MHLRKTIEMTIAPSARQRTAVGLILATMAGLAGLAGCHGTPTGNPTGSATSTARPSPSPTPSPTPTGPVRAPDDPTWTADQIAAVHAVDALYEIDTRMVSDPVHAKYPELVNVAADPLYSRLVQGTQDLIAKGEVYVGDNPYAIALRRQVSVVTTVDGHPEIHVIQCEANNPNGQWIQDNTPVDLGTANSVYDYAVQWIETQEGWRVVDLAKVSDGC